MTSKRIGCGGTVIVLLFWLFWTGMTGLATVGTLLGFVRQAWSYTYVPVEATLVEKSIENPNSEDQKAHVKYQYLVDGKPYESTRISFATSSTSTKEFVDSQLPKEEVGQKVTVYYAPRDPARAVLFRGTNLFDLLVPLFLLPFNAVSFGGGLFLLDSFRSRGLGRSWLGMRVRETDDGLRMTFYEMSPLVAATIAAGATGFVMTFVVLIIPTAWLPGGLKFLLAWGTVAAVVIFAWQKAALMSTILMIDSFRNSLIYIPANSNGEQTFELGEVESIAKIASGIALDDEESTQLFQIVVKLQKGVRLPLTKVQHEEEAKRLVQWLAERLKVGAEEVVERDPDFDDEFGDDNDDDDEDDDEVEDESTEQRS